MIEAIMFDWDGVVSDSDKLQVEAEQLTAATIAEELSIELKTDGLDWSIFRGWARTKIAAALFGIEPTDELAETYRERVVDMTVEIMGEHNLSVIEGVVPFLGYMKHQVDHMSVATSSNRRILEPSIKLFGMNNDFHQTVAHRECLDDKPKPGQYMELMRRFNVDPEQALVIEDSVSGIMAARYSGALTLAIATTRPAEYLRRSTDAHLVACDYEHAAYLLQPYLH